MARRSKDRSVGYPFIAVPRGLITSPEWAALSHRSRVLAVDLMGLYSGKNNGRLCPGIEVMRRCGWTSRDQLNKAKAELLEMTWCIETRKGRPPRTPAWIGFTWWRLDFTPEMEIDPAHWPIWTPLKDVNEGRQNAVKKRSPLTATRSDRAPYLTATRSMEVAQTEAIRPPHGQIEIDRNRPESVVQRGSSGV